VYKEWLHYGLGKKGKSGKGLASYLGIQPSTVSRMLSGKRRIFASELEGISRYIEEPIPLVTNPYPSKEVNQMLILGFINKGIWFDLKQQTPIYEDIPNIPVDGLKAKQFAYVLTYDCHTHLKDSYLITILPHEVNKTFKDNDIVVIERTRDDLSQYILAQVSEADGKLSFFDLDSRIDRMTKIEEEDLFICGLVIGSITRIYRRI